MRRLLLAVYGRRRLSAVLGIVSVLCSAVIALAFAVEMAYLIIQKNYVPFLCIGISALVGFLLVTLFRRLFDAPRPYELYDFYIEKPKEKKGRSFPSRHAYSAFALATLMIYLSIPAAVALFAVAILLCVFRVLLGIHFIRDVITGALVGAFAGVIGLLIIPV